MGTRTIGTELAISGEREFNDAMKSVNSNLKTLKSDMAAVSAEFASNANSVEALTAKQRVLQEQVAQQQAKHDALAQHLEHVKQVYGENSAEADKYRQQLNQSTATLSKFQSDLDKTSSALQKTKKEEETYVPVTERMGSALSDARGKVSQFAADAVAAAGQVPGLAEALQILSGAAGAAGSGLSAAAGGAKSLLSAVAKGAVGAIGAGAAAVGAVTAVAASGVELLTGYATEAAANAQENYDKAQELAKQAAEALKAGKKDQAAELQAQSDAYMAKVDQNYLALNQSLTGFEEASANAKAALGGILLPILGELAGEGGQLLNDFAADMAACGGDTAKMGQTISTYLRKAVDLARQKLPEVMSLAGELLQGLTDGLLENLDPILDTAQEIIQTLLTGIADHADELGAAAVEIIGMLVQTLISVAPQLLTAGMQMLTQLALGLAQNAPQLVSQAFDLVAQLANAFISNAPALLAAGWELIKALGAGIIQNVGEILGLPQDVIDDLVAAFDAGMDKIAEVGLNLVQGIWNGISDAKEWLFGKLSEWVTDIVDWIKSKLGIESPSKVMRDQVGRYMAQGVGAGFTEEMDAVNRRIANSIQTRFDVSPSLRAGGSSLRGGEPLLQDRGGTTYIVTVDGIRYNSDDYVDSSIEAFVQGLIRHNKMYVT